MYPALFHHNILEIDSVKETERLAVFISQQVRALKKDGIVIGLSGGVDSAVTAALSVRAIGADRVWGLLLPEKESSPLSSQYALAHANNLGIRTLTEDITAVLDASGAYRKRDAAIRAVFPAYIETCKINITLQPDVLNHDTYNIFTLTIDDGAGHRHTARLDNTTRNAIVAATNMKQRTRMVALYSFAEANNYLVCGTTNRTELMQGFFVKYGDGGVDIEPLAHLYKTTVYQLAQQLGVTREIIDRPPTPDTYSLPVTDVAFYFRLPFPVLDKLLYAWEHAIPIPDVCAVMRLTDVQVKRAFRDFNAKYNATIIIRRMPQTIEPVCSKG